MNELFVRAEKNPFRSIVYLDGDFLARIHVRAAVLAYTSGWTGRAEYSMRNPNQLLKWLKRLQWLKRKESWQSILEPATL